MERLSRLVSLSGNPLPLAVLLTLVMAGIDAATGPELILIDLMAIGPALAAVSGTPRQVAGVGVLALVLISLVSSTDKIWFEAEQAYGAAAVVGVTVVSIAVAAARRQVLARAQRLAAIVDSSTDAIIARDLDGTITSWNRGAERMFGSSPDEGRGFVDPVPEGQQDELADIRDRILRGEVVMPFESTRRSADGSVRRVTVSALPIRDPAGETTGYYTTSRDITAQRELEEERDRLAGRLQQADRLDSLGQLAGGVAHDFNNLLGVILNYAELAAADPANAVADLTAIQDAANRGAALTSQLLTFSRAEPTVASVVDVGDVAGSVGELLTRTMPANIDLTVERGDGQLRVLADPTQVEQLVMNLAVNSRDAMPHGGQLSIAVRRTAIDDFAASSFPNLGPGSWLVVTVTDTGQGMATEIAEHAFEPFFTTKSRGSGTGLGLATVYGIVRRLGGDATIYSEPGHGTTVRLYLPPTEVPPEAPDAQQPGRAAGSAGGQRVLVVEDQEMLREAIRRMLESAGYRVTDVVTAEDAVPAARDEWPDLLVTDVMLPGRSGVELATELRAERHLPVILMSGYTAPAIGDGLVGYTVLAKPFTLVSFLAAVQEALAAG